MGPSMPQNRGEQDLANGCWVCVLSQERGDETCKRPARVAVTAGSTRIAFYPLGDEGIGQGAAGRASGRSTPGFIAVLSKGCRHRPNQSTENPGRMTDRGLLCWAVLGERGGPPSRISEPYDQIARHSARDLSQRNAQRDAECLRRSTMLELHP
jgi:hypothetical protein